MIKQRIGEQDKALVTRQFLLTSTGDVLGHIEFLERIARRSGIQIAVLDDFDGVSCVRPYESAYVNPEAKFIVELEDSRPGLNCVHYVHTAKIDSILEFIKNKKDN